MKRVALTALCLTCLLVSAFTSAHAAKYEIRDLGPLDGHTYGAAYGINEAGQIAGRSGSHVVLWNTKGVAKDYCVIPEESSGDPMDINRSGQMVGRMFVMKARSVKAVIFKSNGSTQDLGSFGRNASEAWAVNDEGWIVGYSTMPNGDPRAFLWQPGGAMIKLAMTAGAVRSAARDINNSRQVCGSCGTSAVIWTADGKVKDLGTLAGCKSGAAWGLNNKGQVVGGAVDDKGLSKPFVWKQASGMTELPLLPGWKEGLAARVNDSGLIVGWMRNGVRGPREMDKYRAVAWDADGKVIDLGTLKDGTISEAMDVNNAGEIVGRATDKDGKSHAAAWVVQ